VTSRAVSTACALLLGACATAVGAEVADDASPVPEAQAGYQDRLIDGGMLAADVSSDAYGVGSPEGWPRAFRIEGITSHITRKNVDSNESGVRLGGMLDTPDYGAFTLEGNYRSSDHSTYGNGDGSGTLFSLFQRGMPVDGGWFVNSALGVSNSVSDDLARQQTRFYMPTIPMNGVTTEWRGPEGLEFNASAGQPGLFTGLYVPTFKGLGGQLAGLGAQLDFANGWAAALQAVNVQDVGLDLGKSAGTISATSWFGGVAWGTPDTRVQLNVVDSSVDHGSNQAGAWLDAVISDGRVVHSLGAFHLEPDLVWGNQPLASDIEGAYYRFAFQSRRWNLDGGVDTVSPVSGDGDGSIYATGYARYQVSSGLGLGGGGNIRGSSSSAWSTFAFVDARNRWGQGRGQLNYATDDRQDNTQLTLDQTWNLPVGTRMSTSLILGHANFENYSSDTYGLAVYGGGDLGSNLSLDVNARWNKATGEASGDETLANIALNWTFARGWTAAANYYANRSNGRLPLEVTSPIPGQPDFVEQRDDATGFWVSVRYEWQAGSRSAPLGGLPGSGAGSVAGVLYLDENDNGRLDAGENGAPNVTVLLDGRFAARTNADGRFEFPAVAAGNHYLSVVPDNLPLPWVAPTQGRIDIKVSVRDQTRVELPARRPR
jgi:hypothetical protein